ncbi:MAG: hypothetical protein JOY59_02460 [Candidatus Eremiobacteraeota bacterium]|nr:hypothetical protein [Candidatus Eremiobacteraeota bacterium]
MLALVTGCGGGGGGGGTAPPASSPPTATVKASATPTPTPSPSPSPTPTQASVPAAYATLYAGVSSQVTQFAASVASQCANANFATKIYIVDLNADSNSIVNSLPGASAAQVQSLAQGAINEASTDQTILGASGVNISINYPVLLASSKNFPNSTFSTANYPTFLSYYEQVVQGIHALGMSVNVETDLVFPQFVTQQPFNYNGITIPMLEAGVAEVGQHVLDNLHPDTMNLANEPSSIAFATGLALNDPTAYGNFVSAVRSQLSTANSPNSKIGAGSSDWESTQFLTNVVAIPLDFYSLHLYPPDDLQQGISQMAQLKASGKTVAITENFLDKEDVSVDGTTGPIDAQLTFIRDAYSFWANVDQQYVSSVIQLARCDNAQFISFNHPDQYWSYIDYNATTANYDYSQMVAANNQATVQNQRTGTVTPAGNALQLASGKAQAIVRRP